MNFCRALRPFLRFAFHLFYNYFAFTYDFVSALVSRGHWHSWTRAAIPHIVGTRVLDVPCGTGNLMLDLLASGYHAVGVDLSSAMIRISRGKMKRAQHVAPLLRARVEELPFPPAAFDSIVMTFPPGFVFDPRALAALQQVLDDRGRLIWVDAGRLLPRDFWSRALNRALDAVEGEGNWARVAADVLVRAGFDCQVESVRDKSSLVMVAVATKRRVA